MSTAISPLLQARLDALPVGLRAHVERVRSIARELAAVHGVDVTLADVSAAAHDVARHVAPARLIEEAERLGIRVREIERHAPILLHGPVGAAWLEREGAVSEHDALEGVRWHTTAHPDLGQVGRVVLLADKLDPAKAAMYPFQPQLREAAFRSLEDGALLFLDGILRLHVERGDLVHPLAVDSRNALLLARGC